MCKSRILSLLLVLVMVLGMFPVGVFATEETQPAMTTEAATETVSVKSAATAVDAGYRLKATSGSVSYADGKECLAGKASIAELYKDDSFQSRVLLAEGVFSADVTMTESGGFRIMFRRSGSKNYYSFRVLKNGTTNLIKTQNSKETTLSTKVFSAFTSGQVYNLKAVMRKDGSSLRIDCFLDGQFCFSYTDTSPLTGKYVGVRINTDNAAHNGVFENFDVRSFADQLAADDMEQVIGSVYDYTSENLFTYNNNWIEATYYLGVVEAFRGTADKKYYDSAYDYAEAFAWRINQNKLTAYVDDLAIGLVYAQLHDLCSEGYDYKLESAKQQFDYNVSRGEYDYSWIDEIYMGGLTAEYLTKVTGDSKYSDVNVSSYLKYHKQFFDEEDGLWYRDSRYIYGNGNSLSTSPNGKKVFWARGNAWVYVSLAQQLQQMTSDHPLYETYLSDFTKMSAALKERQRYDGFWEANLADPDHIPGRETTGSGGFLYGLAVGLELGILDYDTYYPVAKKGYEGLSAYAVKPNGMLGYCQPVGESPASATTENTNLFGIGLFLMGASKLMTLCEDYDRQLPTLTYEEHNPEKAICNIEDGFYKGGYQSIIATNVSTTESGNEVEHLMNFNWGGAIKGARWSAQKRTDADYAEVLITFNETLQINKLLLVAYQHRAYAFSIETSVDRENWVMIADNMSGQIVSDDNYLTSVVLDQAATARFMRLRVGECLNESTPWISIKGLVLYADPVEGDDFPEKMDLSGAYKWSSTTSDAGASAQAAFDGDMKTRWCASSAKAFPATLSVDLGSVKDIAKIDTYFEQSSEWKYTLFVSVDGKEWVRFGSNPSDVPKQKNYTNENELQGRYVKLEITGAGLDANKNPCWASVYELEVYEKESLYHIVSMDDPNIRYLGRYETLNSGSSSKLFFESGIEVRFTGTTIGVDVTGGRLMYSIDDGPYEDIDINGRVILADDLAEGEHKLKLYNGYQNSRNVLNSILLDSDADLLTPPTTKIIEFVGDSIVAGYGGNYGASGLIRAYPWKTAELLGLSYNVVAYSGIRLCSDGGSDELGMAERYFKTREYLKGETSPDWNTANYIPDYLVLSVTHNDNAAENTIAETYKAYIQKLRTAYPDAVIFVVSPFSGKHKDTLSQMVADIRVQDSNVIFIDTEGWTSEADFYDGLHPTDEGSEKIAHKMAAEISKALNITVKTPDLTINTEKRAKSLNLALEKPCVASSVSTMGGSAAAAFDGNVDTRYCAAGAKMPQTLMVDLGQMKSLDSVYILFEKYSKFIYTVETSQNGKTWETFAVSSGENVFEVTHHGKAEARYLRLVITGSSNGVWASVRELEVFGSEVEVISAAVVNGVKYDTVQAAVDAANGAVVTLMANSDEEITAQGDLYIDLNGFSLKKVTVTGTLYGMDSATDEYTASGAKIETVDGTYAAHYRTEDAKRYMAIAEGEGVSFHRFYMGITSVSLAPAVTGFGYKAEFYGDEAVQALIASVGYNLWLTEDHVVTRTADFKNVLTLRLKNFPVETHGEVPVYANVVVTLTDGTVLESEVISYSMRQMLELIAENFDSLRVSQKKAVQALCLSNETMQTWNVAAILNWVEGVCLTTNYFTETAINEFTLTTNSNAEHLVDDVMISGSIMRETYYSLKGKLTLTNADTWGQARILVSADPNNEYLFALEKVNESKYQIFTMSKSGEESWHDWALVDHSEQNGNRNALDFEVLVIGDALYLLIDDQIYYTANRVSMSESTVKFSGYNTATTTVSNLALEVFADEAAAQTYAATKESRYGENFGSSQRTYWTTNGVDVSADKGENPTISITGGAPQYAYWNDVYADTFTMETEVNVQAVLNNDGYPKFGLLVKGETEMVKFYVDMTPQMTATRVGVVHQPANEADDWANAKSVEVPGMSFTGKDTIKLKLVREGRAYSFYVNDVLVLSEDAGLLAENGAVGIFSFNTQLTASNYSVY